MYDDIFIANHFKRVILLVQIKYLKKLLLKYGGAAKLVDVCDVEADILKKEAQDVTQEGDNACLSIGGEEA